jgi:hypothetical protein
LPGGARHRGGQHDAEGGEYAVGEDLVAGEPARPVDREQPQPESAAELVDDPSGTLQAHQHTESLEEFPHVRRGRGADRRPDAEHGRGGSDRAAGAQSDAPEVIILTTFDADDHVPRALRAGAARDRLTLRTDRERRSRSRSARAG